MSFIYDALYPDVRPLRRATRGSAGYDLHAYLDWRTVKMSLPHGGETTVATGAHGDLTLGPGYRALIPLGFKMQLAPGYEAQVRPRSGRSFKSMLRIANAPGTIDEDFPNEWMVIVWNAGTETIWIKHGDAIAQVVFAKYEVPDIIAGTVGVTTDRVGGLGSTG
jgi:dUTP pyrophosphatase